MNKSTNLPQNLVEEWDCDNNNCSPEEASYWSKKKAYWKCKNGHRWSAQIKSRSLGAKCPYCAGKKVCEDNCLYTKNPELAKEWHKDNILTPNDVTQFSEKKVKWACCNGHEWITTVSLRSQGYGCPYCSGRRLTKEKSLEVVHPELCGEWGRKNEIRPKEISFCSGKVVWWECNKCSSEWKARISDRHNGSGCPYCSGKSVNSTNSLAIINPLLSKEWHQTKNKLLTPEDFVKSTKLKVWWICKKGHEWEASMRVSGSTHDFSRGVKANHFKIILKILKEFVKLMSNNNNMKEKSTERITARISKTHLNMVNELKEKYSINFSQLMRNAIENEYKKRQ